MASNNSYSEETKSKAIDMLCVSPTKRVADTMNIPRTTVFNWKKKFNENAVSNGEDTIEMIRKKNREKFVGTTWKLISKIETLIEKKLDRAIENEDEIARLTKTISDESFKDLSSDERRQTIEKLKNIKVENIRDITLVLATLYDKQELAERNGRISAEGIIAFRKFEDY